MKNGTAFRSGKSSIFKSAFSNGWSSRGWEQNDTADLSVRLQQSRVALAELMQVLIVNERHLTAVQKKLEIFVEINLHLQRKLIALEKEVATANHLAYHDMLTGLPNRRLLLDRLNQAIALASRQKKRVALVFFDVDGFKAINDKLGHLTGDRLLQAVAQRLSCCLRSEDTACRYGGDEFIVMLPEVDSTQSATIVEQKIRTQLTSPYNQG